MLSENHLQRERCLPQGADLCRKWVEQVRTRCCLESHLSQFLGDLIGPKSELPIITQVASYGKCRKTGISVTESSSSLPQVSQWKSNPRWCAHRTRGLG